MSNNRLLWLLGSLVMIVVLANDGAGQEPLSLDPDSKATQFDVSDVPPTRLHDGGQIVADRSKSATPTPDLVAIWKTTARQLGITLLVFASVVFIGQFYLIAKSRKGWDDRSFKAFGLTLILITSMFLVLLGFDDKQLAPMIGLLGTLAGYILGTGNKT
jgi:hypothetical protein